MIILFIPALSFSNEKDWYKWGDKKVIFNDINELVENLLRFKENKSQIDHFGNWAEQKNIYNVYIFFLFMCKSKKKNLMCSEKKK